MTVANREKTQQKIKNKYVSFPEKKTEETEIQLYKIFEEEKNSKNGIIKYYNPIIVKKAAKFLTGEIKRPVSIGIAGETAGGKSTVTFDIIETLEDFSKIYNTDRIVTRVNTDDYYYDRSKEIKQAGGMAEFAKTYDFDVPEALELDLMYKHICSLISGKSVMLPKYDMSGTAVRIDNYTLAHPSIIIISEGLFTLTDKIKNAFDFKIFVDIDSRVQKERFFKRAKERGLGNSAENIYKNASDKAQIYIRPCKSYADIVISGEAQRSGYKIFLNKILSIVEQIHFLKQEFNDETMFISGKF